MLQAHFQEPGQTDLQRNVRSDQFRDGKLYKGDGDGHLYFKAYENYIVRLSPDQDGTGILGVDTGYGGTFSEVRGDVVLNFNG